VRLLLEPGADPNLPEGTNCPRGFALWSAARHNRREIAERTYRAFIAETVGRHNARHRARIADERAMLERLRCSEGFGWSPSRQPNSGFTARKVLYLSVTSRLIGRTLRVHL